MIRLDPLEMQVCAPCNRLSPVGPPWFVLPVEEMDENQGVHSLEGSFDAFFRSEYRQVLGLAYVLAGSWPAAEELTMDAFERALRHWPNVAAMDSPGAWVRKLVSNAAVSRFRRLGAERRAHARLPASETTDMDSDSSEVWDAVRRLPVRQAQAIALFYVGGYTRKEIADLLGVSDESIKTHLDRARKRLEQELG